MSVLGHEVAGPANEPGTGDGLPLLLGSSLGTTRSMWDPHWPALTARFRAVRYDHLGHGGSDVPRRPCSIEDLGTAVLDLADHVGAERFHYAGVSLGGMVGLWLAATAPHRVASLTLLCTSAYMPPAEAWQQRADTVRDGGMHAVSVAVWSRWFTPEFVERRPEVAHALLDQLEAQPPTGYAACCEAIGAMDLRPQLAKIVAPTLVVAAERDLATPAHGHADVIVDAVAGARLEVVPGSHLAAVESAERVTELVVQQVTGRNRP